MDRNEIIAKLRKFFSTSDNILLSFLFGSSSRDKLIEESDIDIAVWFNKNFTLKEINRLWGELEIFLKKNVDLVILNNATPTIAWTSLRGVPIVIRDNNFYLNYMLKVSMEAEDFQDFILDFWELRQKIKNVTSK